MSDFLANPKVHAIITIVLAVASALVVMAPTSFAAKVASLVIQAAAQVGIHFLPSAPASDAMQTLK